MVLAGVFIALGLAFANGANDHFKGVATLFGSGTVRYRSALGLAIVATGLGSLAAVFLARGLIQRFSGKGLVPDELVADPGFALAVALAAAITVLLASRFGIPISTTHSLIGALIGVGLVAAPQALNGAGLMSGMVIPLLTSPLIAVLLAATLYRPLRALRQRWGLTHETCICVAGQEIAMLPGQPSREQAISMVAFPRVDLADQATCSTRYRGAVLGISARSLVDSCHYLSAATVSFARGLNDTPKIAALLLVGSAVHIPTAMILTAGAMALGAVLMTRRVAITMSHKVTELNPGQGLTANFTTSALVIGASFLGLPVSTTHVSCGALFGIGAVSGGAHWSTIRSIVGAWVLTLPVAGLLGAVTRWLLV